jgi:SAM-dependent methyltransferase
MSRATLDFDSLASAYDAWFDEEGKLIFAIEVEALQGVLPLLARPWLEVGVGSGRFAQALGIETGVDPSIKLLEMARRRGITGFLARGEERLFDEETFGAVFMIVTLCFVESPLAVLRETRRILKAEGKIALGLVLRDSPWGQFYLANKDEGHRFYRHAAFYSYDEVVKLLGKAGFAVERVVSTLLQKPGEVADMEAPRDGVSHDAGFTIVVADKIDGGSTRDRRI